MTDKQDNSIAIPLAAATCTLLGTAPTSPANAQEDPGWDFNTSFLYYGESDDRVQDASLSFLARRLFTDDKSLTLTLAVDSLTGASASGATPMDVAQTFTSASGNAVYTTAAGEHPLDDAFLDTRVAIGASWQQPLGRLYKMSAGLTASGEYDYKHIGGNFGLSRDFNQRNTTISVGVAVARDTLDPEGGAPISLARMLDVGDRSNKMGDQDKDVVDFLLGVTQVVNRNLLVQLNYSYSDSSGYLNDPYKFISMVDPVTGDTVAHTPAPGTAGPSHEFRFESRPKDRAKHSLFGQAKYYWSGRVVDLSYRYMTDDWDIDSHTLDAKLRFPMGDSRYLEPHVRFYSQSEAEFYSASLIEGDPLPAYASSDYRLGDFDAITAGIKYGWKTGSGNDMSVRLEYYTQDGEIPAGQIIGNQSQRTLYPDLDAIIFNFSYRFGK